MGGWGDGRDVRCAGRYYHQLVASMSYERSQYAEEGRRNPFLFLHVSTYKVLLLEHE